MTIGQIPDESQHLPGINAAGTPNGDGLPYSEPGKRHQLTKTTLPLPDEADDGAPTPATPSCHYHLLGIIQYSSQITNAFKNAREQKSPQNLRSCSTFSVPHTTLPRLALPADCRIFFSPALDFPMVPSCTNCNSLCRSVALVSELHVPTSRV